MGCCNTIRYEEAIGDNYIAQQRSCDPQKWFFVALAVIAAVASLVAGCMGLAGYLGAFNSVNLEVAQILMGVGFAVFVIHTILAIVMSCQKEKPDLVFKKISKEESKELTPLEKVQGYCDTAKQCIKDLDSQGAKNAIEWAITGLPEDGERQAMIMALCEIAEVEIQLTPGKTPSTLAKAAKLENKWPSENENLKDRIECLCTIAKLYSDASGVKNEDFSTLFLKRAEECAEKMEVHQRAAMFDLISKAATHCYKITEAQRLNQIAADLRMRQS